MAEKANINLPSSYFFIEVIPFDPLLIYNSFQSYAGRVLTMCKVPAKYEKNLCFICLKYKDVRLYLHQSTTPSSYGSSSSPSRSGTSVPLTKQSVARDDVGKDCSVP